MRVRHLVGILLALALAAPLHAQSRVSIEVDSTRVTVGDRITMTVRIQHAPSTRVA